MDEEYCTYVVIPASAFGPAATVFADGAWTTLWVPAGA